MHLLCFHIREANALIVEVMHAPQSRHLQTFLRIPLELHICLSLSLSSCALAIIHTLSHLVTSHASSIRSLRGSILLTLFWPYRSSHESWRFINFIRLYLSDLPRHRLPASFAASAAYAASRFGHRGAKLYSAQSPGTSRNKSDQLTKWFEYFWIG